MDEKSIWSMFIFHLTYCIIISSGCEYVNNNCYTDIYCKTADLNLDYYRIASGVECQNVAIYNGYNGYRCTPLRIRTDSKEVVESFVYLKGRYIERFIVSLEITNTLQITPDLSEMTNLKKLNLSNNYLKVGKLYNKFKLDSLQNLDLSHNSINSIQVDDNQNVYKSLQMLNLSNNILNNIPGGIFEKFKLLKRLDLSYNDIVVIDHFSFEGLRNLKYLSLSHNNISNINVSLFRFIELEELYLDNNNIENLLTQDFGALRGLQTLDLDFNRIGSLQKDVFSNMVFLTTLKLHHNLLIHIHNDTFLSTINLKNIDLSYNLITNLPTYLFTNNNITSISIIGNNLEGAIRRGTFEGLQLITELDISFQVINALEQFAFFGLENLATLLLNNNRIRFIAENSFNTLICLEELNLSNNFITSIDFNKKDLVSLEVIYLSKNLINQIFQEDLLGLNRLSFLDLSNNNISKIETGSFNNTESIQNLKIFNNPISGPLLSNSFAGLHFVPVLDLSRTSITSIQNGSLSGMLQLLEFNISRSSLNSLEYSAFVNTGNISYMDLSFNKLTDLNVNGNDLNSLKVLYLNNNAIIHISHNFFNNMHMLNKIFLSYNFIGTIDDGCFADQTDLNYLDVSFNNNLTFHTWAVNITRTIDTLLLSGVKNVTDFIYISTVPVRKLELSHLRIRNISMLHLNTMIHLTNLVINNNNIAHIEASALKNMSALKWLDLSFNNISYIQPGTFKDNVYLQNLNLSHNLLTSLNYGIFRGLIGLNILDISYNGIHDLGKDQFYDTQNLRILFADHNRITAINGNFFDIQLDLLSIGHNPLSCDKVILLKQRSSFHISAINLDETSGDNINGIVCNINNHKSDIRVDVMKFGTTINEKILVDIRDILFNLSESRGLKKPKDSGNIEQLNDISNKIDKYSIDQNIQLKNITSEVIDEVNRTNTFLERILKVILGLGSFQNRPVADRGNDSMSNKDNGKFVQNNTFMGNHSKLDALVLDVSQMKQEFLYMENVISEIDRKISQGSSLNTLSVLEKLNKSDHVMDINTNGTFIFLEVSVSLILVMLVCFMLYKFYEIKLLNSTRSLSTRHITDALDNSNL